MRDAIERFHEIYYPIHRGAWRGVPIAKCAQDLLVFQEIIHETRPEVIIECGVDCGGSTLFLAEMLRGAGGWKVVACDIAAERCYDVVVERDDVILFGGSSTNSEVIGQIASLVRGRRTMVILDSDHREEHVLAECRAYGPFVSPGCYMIVEDTNVNGHPVVPEHGPGPAEAVVKFLSESGAFEVDRSRERLLLTFNSGGYLRRRLQ